jgi:DNA-binding CsgD family transcriptional regulator
MTALSERDVRSVMDLVYDAGTHAGPKPFPPEFLEGLARLIPVDAIVGYKEAVVAFPGRAVEAVVIPNEPIPPAVEDAAGPLCYQDPLRHGLRRRERRALKLSDFLTRRQMRSLAFYHEVWKPLGVDDSLRVWLPAPEGRARQIYLERGSRNFTDRDRSVLELIRPALIKMQTNAAKWRAQSPLGSSQLTKRETEILGWIADGRTTKEIAAILVVSPHTVRKHVEHILEKLDVRTRSAAVARVFPKTTSQAMSDVEESASG